MPTYKIIGADQKEYGPVSAEEISQWIKEGRADGRTLARLEPGGEWKPLASYPEFAAALATGPFANNPSSPPTPSSPVLTNEELTGTDYQLDIVSCLSRGWELVKNNFLAIVGVTFLVMVIMGIINEGLSLISNSAMENLMQSVITRHEFTTDGLWLIMLTWVLTIPIQTVFTGGIYKYYLMHIRNEQPEIGDAFAGITESFVQLCLLGLVMTFFILVGFLFCVLPGIYLSVAWYFAMPLVVDKRMNFWDAMMLSMKMVNKHWFMVFALIVVFIIVMLLGFCVLCIGIFVAAPIAYAALMYAYEDIFCRRTN